MAVEIASAYVSIVPTTKGIQANLEKELSPLTGAAAKAGDDSGRALKSGFASSGSLKSSVDKAGDDLAPLSGHAQRAGADSGHALGSSFAGSSGGLKSSLGEAEGHFGKFKTGAVGALDSVGVSSGMLATAGVGALVGFGVKALGVFTDTAKAALDLGTATGLSTEEASRWIAVGDDMGVSAETLQGSIGKVSKTLDDTKWADFGVATRDAGGKARDVNDILLDSIDKLGKVTNETDRAREGNRLFGKGYSGLAPLIGKTREEMEGYLGSVEKGQVITAGEAAKAEKMRLAQDALKDAFGEVTMAVGAMVAGLAPLLEKLAQVVAVTVGVDTASSDVQDQLKALSDEANRGGKSWEDYNADVLRGKMTLEGAIAAIHLAATANEDATRSSQGYSYALQDVERMTIATEAAVKNSTNSTEGYSYAIADVARADADASVRLKANADSTARAVKGSIDEMIRKWDELTGNVDADNAWLDLQTQFDDLKQAGIDAFTAAANHSADAEQKGRDYQHMINDTTKDVGTYAGKVIEVPKEWATMFKAEFDKGQFDLVESQLAILTRNRNFNIQADIKGSAGYFTGPRGAEGGIVKATPGGTLVMVGEGRWDEAIVPLDGHRAWNASLMANATSAGPVAAGQTINVYNNRRDIGVGDLNQILAMARLT